MANPTWNDDTADWTTAADWSTGAVPGAGDNVTVASGDGPPQVTTNVPTIASLVDQGEVDVLSGGTLTDTGDLAPTDAGGGGAGILVIDSSGGAANAVMNVGGALVNSVQPPTFVFPEDVNFAQIALTGGTSSRSQLNFTTAAAGIGGAGVIGDGGADGGTIASVTLTGNAQITFASGTITTLADGATLELNGAGASIAVAGQGANSALAGLATIGGTSTDAFGTASFELYNGASVTTTTGMINDALIDVDHGAGSGGSSLHIGGVLTNAGTLDVGTGEAETTPTNVTAQGLSNTGTILVEGASAAPVTLTADGTAGFGTAGHLSGNVTLFEDGVIQFGSGEITTIDGTLSMTGPGASIQDTGGALNSALTGLATVSTGGELDLLGGDMGFAGGAKVTTGALTNDGTIDISPGMNGVGGASLTVQGALTNAGTLDIAGDAETSTVSAQSVANAATGKIVVDGEGLLEIAGAAGFGTAGIVTGAVTAAGGTIQFDGGGEITTIAAGADLALDGAASSIQDNGGAQDSALTGLTVNDGTLGLVSGAKLTTAGPLTNAAGAEILVDSDGRAATTLTIGSATGFGTPGVVTGTVVVGGVGQIALTGGGEITTIAANSTLLLQGSSSIVDTSGGSALSGLTTNAGTLHLADHTLDVGGDLTNAGTLALDTAPPGPAGSGDLGDIGGSTLNVAGTLTNTGTIRQGMAQLAFPDAITAGALVNSGTIGLIATSTQNSATFTVSGTATNAGSLGIGAFSTLSAAGGFTQTAGTTDVEGTLTGASTVTGGKLEGSGTTGAVTVEGDGTFAAGTPATTGDPTLGTLSTGNLAFASGGAFQEEIGGAGSFEAANVTGTVTLGGAALNASLVDGFAPTTGESFTIISNDGTDAVGGTFAGLAQGATTNIGGNAFTISYVGGDGNDVVLTDVGPVCFASGTSIRTTGGDIPVEKLAVGDHVVTGSGEARPIRWLGHRTIDCRRHPRAAEVMPVRIAAHAFGPARPARDLLVSPGHSICVDVLGEVLIPAGSLVNGATITQVEVEAATYWHVELDRHDIVLAENLPAESYLEMGNRGFFTRSRISVLDGRPDAPVRTHADFCRPFHDGGPVVEAVRARLRRQALRLEMGAGRETPTCGGVAAREPDVARPRVEAA